TLNENAISIRHILQWLGCATAAKRGSQTGNRGGVSYTSLVFDLHRASCRKQLFNDVVFLVIQGCAAQASHTHGAVEDAAFIILVLPLIAARLDKTIRDHIHRGFDIDVFPLSSVGSAVFELGQTRRGVYELLRRCTLGAQATTRNR